MYFAYHSFHFFHCSTALAETRIYEFFLYHYKLESYLDWDNIFLFNPYHGLDIQCSKLYIRIS